MKNILDYLKQLDFSEIEAKIYLTLLKSDSMTVAELAHKTRMNRTAVYPYIKSLLTKGVITELKGTRNKIAANSPEHLQYLVEQKANTVKNLETQLPKMINSLSAIFTPEKKENTSEIKYYKGRMAVRAIYEDCLKAKKIRAYFNPGDLDKVFPENSKLFNDTIANTPDMVVYELVEASLESQIIVKETQIERHIFKLLPEDVKLTANDILIFDGKVAIINIGDKQNVNGVALQNKEYYNNSVQLFDLLWRLLPESK